MTVRNACVDERNTSVTKFYELCKWNSIFSVTVLQMLFFTWYAYDTLTQCEILLIYETLKVFHLIVNE